MKKEFLPLILNLIGIIASVIQIFTAGTTGVVVSASLVILVLFAGGYLFWHILKKNARGTRFYSAIVRAGLVDIEDRNQTSLLLPPNEFYPLAKNEIVITGVTCFRTIDQHHEVLNTALTTGRKVHLLIFHPENPRLDEINVIAGKNVKKELDLSIGLIKSKGLYGRAGFQIRFVNNSPPYSCVMIDGDLVSTTASLKDKDGQIRIQPYTTFFTTEKGVVLQFKNHVKKADEEKTVFEYFAQDLRKQWNEATESPELFA